MPVIEPLLTYSPARRRLIRGATCAIATLLMPIGSRRGGPATVAASAVTSDPIILRAEANARPRRGTERFAKQVWGFGAVTPGPLLRVRKGEPLYVTLINDLPLPTAIHWHGLRVPARMDGAPPLTQAPVHPGEAHTYGFRPPDAGTFWYHAPRSLGAEPAVGLCGPLIVDETEPVPVDRDLLLAFSVWDAGQDAIAGAPKSPRVVISEYPEPEVAVRTGEWLRLRLVNMSALAIALRLEGHRVTVGAIDGQPAEPYEARDARVVLGPGNRIDWFVHTDLPRGRKADLLADAGAGEMPVMQLLYAENAQEFPAPRVPSLEPPRLPPSALPERMDFAAALKLDITLDDGTIGPTPLAGAVKPVAMLKRGRTLMLGLINRSERARAVHIHGHHFRLLDRLDDGWKPFWLDTIMIRPRITERIALVADNPGHWMIEHFAVGDPSDHAWAWFAVT